VKQILVAVLCVFGAFYSGELIGMNKAENACVQKLKDNTPTSVPAAKPVDGPKTPEAGPVPLSAQYHPSVFKVKRGDKATVPQWQWVNIEHHGDYRPSTFEATCGIEPGGFVTALASEDDTVLVKYYPPMGRANPGTPCQGGEMFLLTHEDFTTMTERFNAKWAEAKEHEELIKRLLEKAR
jgi:hypothetical protein